METANGAKQLWKYRFYSGFSLIKLLQKQCLKKKDKDISIIMIKMSKNVSLMVH